MRVDGHLAPEHQRDAALRAPLLERALRVAHARGVVVREEEHGHAVIALVGQQLALLLGLLAEETMRNLEQHAGTVAGIALQAGAATVLKVHEHGKRVVEHGVASLPLQVGQGADAACIVLITGSVQAGRVRHGRRGCGMHATSRFVRALRAGEASGRPRFAGCLGLFGKFSVHMRSFVWMIRPPENVSGPHSVCRPRVTQAFPPLRLTSWKQHRSKVETWRRTGRRSPLPATARCCPLPNTGERERTGKGDTAHLRARPATAIRRRKRRAFPFRKRSRVSYHVRNVFTFGEESL